MSILFSTIAVIGSILIVTGQKLENIENGKICTAWQTASGGTSANVDASRCSGPLGYELVKSNNGYVVRFCCSYQPSTQAPVIPSSSTCGRAAFPPSSTRIVGGQEATPHSWPWLVSLQYHGSHFCGGTLIDKQHVLTAAHCLQDKSMFNSAFTVVAGLHTRSKSNQAQIQRKQVASVLNHGGYNEHTNENDVAVLRLASPVTITNYVNVACLPGKDPTLHENVMIAGWGSTSFGGNSPDSLRQANVLIMDLCKQVYYFDDKKQLCAGNYQYSKDSCQGDSGGPLMYEINGRWVLSGVVSYGDECAKVNRPGVYSRVSHYLPWIQNAISTLSGK